MWLEEVQKLSKKQLRALINRSFELAEEPGRDRGPLYEKAGFYMRELEHRRDSRVSIRDFILEIVVIALIGWEIWMGYRAEHVQNTNFEAEKHVFENLEKSSIATAGSLMAAQQLLQNMNGALQKQLALFYDVSVNVFFDEQKKEIIFANNGRTNLTLWGTKLEGEAPEIMKEGRMIPPGGAFKIDAVTTYNFMARRFPKPSQGLVDFEVYLKNERGEEFFERGNIGMRWQNDTGQLLVQTKTIEPEHWSRNLKGENITSGKAP
jgi:hypothetical protein